MKTMKNKNNKILLILDNYQGIFTERLYSKIININDTLKVQFNVSIYDSIKPCSNML